MAYPNAMMPLVRVPQIMDRGTVLGAIFTSSAMWMTPSTPKIVSELCFLNILSVLLTTQGRHHAQKTNSPSYAWTRPAADSADKSIPHKFIWIARGKSDKNCNGHGQEDDVHDASCYLDDRQDPPGINVDDYRDDQDCPRQQRALVSLDVIAFAVERNQPQNLVADHEGRQADQGTPGEDLLN